MMDIGTSRSFGGLPPKTIHTVFWLVVMGTAAFFWHRHALSRMGDVDVSYDDAIDSPGTIAMLPFLARDSLLQSVLPKVPIEDVSKSHPRDRKTHWTIEDPKHSMCGFYQALFELENEKSNHDPVRVLHYGDSLLTSDELTGKARRILQQRFGDGGHGFVLMGKPWRWYHHLDVVNGAHGNWKVRPLNSAPFRDGRHGLGGVAFETKQLGATAWVGVAKHERWGTSVSSFDVSYLLQPQGGSFDVYIDGKKRETVSTAADSLDTAHRVIRISKGKAKLKIRTLGDGPVRIFGAVLESGEPGVVYDSLAINGARASAFRHFDKQHWQSELRHREANLVVMMCGANEGHNEWLPLEEYRTELADVLQTIQESVPGAGCLVVGPLDQAKRKSDGKLTSRRMPGKLSDVQRAVSLEHGCAFFDTYRAMGGKNSMAKWFRTGLGGGDFVHPTEEGARQIGTWIADALLAGYEQYMDDKKQCELSVTSL